MIRIPWEPPTSLFRAMSVLLVCTALVCAMPGWGAIDLEYHGLPETGNPNEHSPGAFLMVGADTAVSLSGWANGAGVRTLTISSNTANICIVKGGTALQQQTWAFTTDQEGPTDVPAAWVTIRCLAPSAGATLTATYTEPGLGTSTDDITITAVQITITPPSLVGTKLNPGFFLPPNVDDDNNNGIRDCEETTQSAVDDDDLQELSITIQPALSVGQIQMRFREHLGYKVWSDRQKTTNLTADPYVWNAATPPTKLYLEGDESMHVGSGILGIYYAPYHADDYVNAYDEIRVVTAGIYMTHCPRLLTPGRQHIIRFMPFCTSGTFNICSVQVWRRNAQGFPTQLVRTLASNIALAFGEQTELIYDAQGLPLDPGKYVLMLWAQNAQYPTWQWYNFVPFNLPGYPVHESGCVPTDGLGVALPTGDLKVDSILDLTARNGQGPSASFFRTFSSALVETGYGSPGFPVGWVHNYDITICDRERPFTTPGGWSYGPYYATPAWGSLSLCYGDGTEDVLIPRPPKPETPTTFIEPLGAPYEVFAERTATVGHYAKITVAWKNGTKWELTPHAAGVYALTKITDRLGSVVFQWSQDRTSCAISQEGGGSLLSWSSGGVSGGGLNVTYRVEGPDQGPQAIFSTKYLTGVSRVWATGSPPSATDPWRYTYTYVPYSTQKPLLEKISVPNPADKTPDNIDRLDVAISYDANWRVSAVASLKGSRTYTYNAASTQVTATDPEDNALNSYLQYFDTFGRDLGSSINDGPRYTVGYGDPLNPTKPTTITHRDGSVTALVYDRYGTVTDTLNTPAPAPE